MKNYIKAILFIMSMPVSINLSGQIPAPALPQGEAIYIVGGTVHLGNGQALENGIVAFEKGKITVVGTPGNLPEINLSRYQVVDAKGKHIYPGFIAPNTQLGLVEINAVRATRDMREVGIINPNVRAIIAYNTDSDVIPTVRSQGVLLAQITPQGGGISGSSTVVHLDAWNWEDAAMKTDEGIHLNWPNEFRYRWRSRSYEENEDYAEQLKEINQFFEEAKAYTAMAKPKPVNLKFEAMRGLFGGSQKLYIHTNTAKSITQAVQLAKKYGVKLVIVGGSDSWMVSDLLKENGVAVMLAESQALPSRVDDAIDQPFRTPALLEEAGVLYCIGIDGYWQLRNLAFQAGQSVGFGLDYEKAVQAITLNTAKILGIDAQVGSLEVGKDATLIITSGDALDMRSSTVEQAFIQGRSIDLDNKHRKLYEKFKTKYELGQ